MIPCVLQECLQVSWWHFNYCLALNNKCLTTSLTVTQTSWPSNPPDEVNSTTSGTWNMRKAFYCFSFALPKHLVCNSKVCVQQPRPCDWTRILTNMWESFVFVHSNSVHVGWVCARVCVGTDKGACVLLTWQNYNAEHEW